MIAEIDIKDLEDYQEAAYGTALPSVLNHPYLFSGLTGEIGEVCKMELEKHFPNVMKAFMETQNGRTD